MSNIDHYEPSDAQQEQDRRELELYDHPDMRITSAIRELELRIQRLDWQVKSLQKKLLQL